jgi:type II secretory ATPase GspE/PulE/Tfp pilus assembly ATPase PilB-like protein
MVAAQRLVRLICKHCKEPMSDADHDRIRGQFGDQVPDVLYKGKGCRQCNGTGYRGRQGVFELMPVSDEIREKILRRSSSGEIRKIAIQQGMNSLRGDGWRLIREGRTTLEEVLRMTKDETIAVGAEALGMNVSAMHT